MRIEIAALTDLISASHAQKSALALLCISLAATPSNVASLARLIASSTYKVATMLRALCISSKLNSLLPTSSTKTFVNAVIVSSKETIKIASRLLARAGNQFLVGKLQVIQYKSIVGAGRDLGRYVIKIS